MRTWVRKVVLVGCLVPWTALAGPIDLSLSGFGSFFRTEDLDEAYGGGVKLKLEVLDYFAADARISYVGFDEGDVEMVPVEVAAMVQLPLLNKTLVPYAGIGVGYYSFQTGKIDLEDDFGFWPVLGAELRLGKKKQLGVFAEARWLLLRADVKNSSQRADLSGVGVNIGLTYHFW